MAFAAFPATEMRPTTLLLNIVAAGYATWRLNRRAAIDSKMLLQVTVPSLVTTIIGGLLVLGGQVYFTLTGLLLVVTAALMIFKRTADTVQARSLAVRQHQSERLDNFKVAKVSHPYISCSAVR